MNRDSSIRIRKAEYKDLKSIINLYKQLNKNIDFDSINSLILQCYWEEIKRDGCHSIYVLEHKKQIMTVCTFIVIKNIAQGMKPNAVIESFVTDEEHRSEGYGKKLLQYLLEIAEDLNCHKVMLMVKPENSKAKLFYEKMGFNSKMRYGLSIIINPI